MGKGAMKMRPSQKKSYSSKRIQLPVIVPASSLVIILFILLIGFVYLEQEKHMQKETLSHIHQFQDSFQKFMASDADLLGGLLYFIGNEGGLRKEFLAQNRKGLIENSKEIFQKIKADYDVTHFYFINKDNICFLRAHNTSRHGDTINRFTLKQAVATGQPFYGIELGPLGTFTLRMVHPWRIDGEIVGYIELGKEIDYMTPELSHLLHVGLVFTIFKDHLERQAWEEGLQMMGNKADWNEFGSFVVTSRSFQVFSERLKNIASEVQNHDQLFLFKDEADGNYWQAGATALIDAGNQQVGNVYVFRNVSLEVSLVEKLKFGALFIIFAFGGILFFFYWRYIKNLETDLTSLYESLNVEITQRKRIAMQLHELSMQYQLILNSAGEGIYGLDLEGNTTFINIAGAKMLGYTIEELTGKHLHSIVHSKKTDGSTYSWDQCPVNKIMQGGGIYSASNEVFWTKDHKAMPIEYLVHPIKEEGAIKGAVVVFKDISDRLEKEHKLEVAQKKVLQSEKLAGVGRLAAGVSHEVLNPLNIISIYVQMLLKKTDQEMGMKQPLLKIKDEVKRISKIVSTLSFYSQKGRNTLVKASVHELIDEALLKLDAELKSGSIDVKRSFNSALPEVDWDLCEMEEAFSCLLKNAIEAIQGPGWIEIKTDLLTVQESDRIRIVVSDSGCGIPKENQGKIFDPFFTTKEDIYGAGMGLSVCQSFVEKNNGSILIESELGKGTKVTLEFVVLNK